MMMVIGCGGASPEPAPPPSNTPPAPALRCKTAVEQAAAAVKLRDKDVTMAIGECEQHEWTQTARECVAAAHTSDAVAACGKSYDLGRRGIIASTASAEAALKEMERFRDEMCACKDSPCAQHVADEMGKWAQEQAKSQEEAPHMTDEDTKRATAIGEEMGQCMQKAMSASPPQSP